MTVYRTDKRPRTSDPLSICVHSHASVIVYIDLTDDHNQRENQTTSWQTAEVEEEAAEVRESPIAEGQSGHLPISEV